MLVLIQLIWGNAYDDTMGDNHVIPFDHTSAFPASHLHRSPTPALTLNPPLCPVHYSGQLNIRCSLSSLPSQPLPPSVFPAALTFPLPPSLRPASLYVCRYNYDADCSEATVFPRSRFISEFGFQSFPSFISWRAISEPSDWEYRSDLSLYRQHHAGGQDQMEAQIRRHFPFPNSTQRQTLFDDTIYMTQVQQAFCYSMGIQVWRRIKDESPGHTMGIIYWQMEDIWQAPTWASLEYGGRWKVLHSTLRRVFAPSIVSAYVTPIGHANASLYVYAVSDSTQAQKGTIEMHLRLWSTGALTYTQTLPFSVPALTSLRLLNSTVDSFTAKAGAQCAPITDCFLQLRWMNGKEVVSEYVLMLGQLTPAPLRDPQIKIVVSSLSAGRVEVEPRRMEVMGVKGEGVEGVGVMTATLTVSSVAPAAWVWMETETPGWFTDNAFTLLPGENRTVQFVGYEAFQGGRYAEDAAGEERVGRHTQKLRGGSAAENGGCERDERRSDVSSLDSYSVRSHRRFSGISYSASITTLSARIRRPLPLDCCCSPIHLLVLTPLLLLLFLLLVVCVSLRFPPVCPDLYARECVAVLRLAQVVICSRSDSVSVHLR